MKKRAPLADRFWSKVQKAEGCWNWTAGASSRGYGVLEVGGRQMRAHRISWELRHGPIPAGVHVCHRCDNPRCVRPEHLWLGTNSDNMRDASQKGRIAFGSRNGSAKLIEAEVSDILRLYERGEHSQREIARRHGVTQATISHIVRREQWTHLGRAR